MIAARIVAPMGNSLQKIKSQSYSDIFPHETSLYIPVQCFCRSRSHNEINDLDQYARPLLLYYSAVISRIEHLSILATTKDNKQNRELPFSHASHTICYFSAESLFSYWVVHYIVNMTHTITHKIIIQSNARLNECLHNGLANIKILPISMMCASRQ